MNVAAQIGIDVAPHGLFDLRDGSKAYVVRRFDRTDSGERKRCEDFAQILGRDKYSGSVEQVGRRLKEISLFPGLDAQLLFERVLLSFLLGNGDAHLKNYSVVETEDRALRLSPAYDIVCSKLVIPEELDSALTINGRRNRLRRRDFGALASDLGIPAKAVESILERMGAVRDRVRELIPESWLAPEDQERMLAIVDERWQRIFG
jgi:serine/threonine-protein kinase HipA